MGHKHVVKPIILASSSPRREQLVRSLGLEATILPSDVDEDFDPRMTPSRVVCELATRKAIAVSDKLAGTADRNGLVIAADTIVVLNGNVLGKPEHPAHALEMLLALQGKVHEVYTGVALFDCETGSSRVDYRVTRVHMKRSGRERLERYVNTGEPMDKAGAYGIQGLGATLVESIDGCYFNVVGLPVALLSDMLSEFGIEVV